MKKTHLKSSKSGSALVVLLVLMVVAITITSAAVMITLVNSQATTRGVMGEYTLDIAESGAENALLRLLRDPNFAGETIQVNGGISTSTISGSPNKTIVSDGKLGAFTRKVQVTVSYTNDIMNIISWKEIAP